MGTIERVTISLLIILGIFLAGITFAAQEKIFYESLSRPIITNLSGIKRLYVRFLVDVVCENGNTRDSIFDNRELLIDQTYMVLSDKREADLDSKSGRNKLREELKAGFKKVLEKNKQSYAIKEVLLTDFLIDN